MPCASFDDCLRNGFARLGPQHRESLGALAATLNGSPLERPIAEAMAAVGRSEFRTGHFVSLAAARAAIADLDLDGDAEVVVSIGSATTLDADGGLVVIDSTGGVLELFLDGQRRNSITRPTILRDSTYGVEIGHAVYSSYTWDGRVDEVRRLAALAAVLAAALRDLPVAEYSPAQIKSAVAGTGRATKEQVQYMVKTLLHLREAPRPADAADGVAVALCHCNAGALAARLAGGAA